MIQNIIDIHSHILPGLDDGARTLEETMETLSHAREQNVRDIFVTPHFHPGRYMVSPSEIYRSADVVRRECERRGLDIRLHLGQECYYYSELAEHLQKGTVLTLADSRYVLLEFDPDCSYSRMLYGVQELLSIGYQPVLAHFERYRCLNHMEHLYELRERGVLLQMNFDTLHGRGFLFGRNPWRAMVKQGLVDYLGSDCHGTHFRPLQITDTLKWMEKELEPELLHQLLVRNPENILNEDR